MDWYFLALLVIGLWRCMMIVCGSGTRAQWHSVIAGGGGTQKSSWLLLVRLRRPVHSRASQWICNTAGGGSSMGGGYAARQLPTKSTPAPTWCRPSAHPLSKAWINRPASTATPHFTYWWVPFPATGPSRCPWPMYIHLGTNLATNHRRMH